MKLIETGFDGLVIIEPKVFGDARGYFMETWNKAAFAEVGIRYDFVQDNQSASVKDVLRGLHFQVPPHEQGKLVRVLSGSVLDVAVDLRKKSPTFGKPYSLVLTAASHRLLFIPPGFAHGFRTLEDDTVFAYKCTAIYHADSERTISWDDPDLAIDWGISTPILSVKDTQGVQFRDFDSPF